MKKSIFIILLILSFLFFSCSNTKIDDLRSEANALTVEEVPAWLHKHDILVPEDLRSTVDIPKFVLNILDNAAQGIDSSVISYTKTRDFVIAIQKASGYEFNH